MGQWVFTPHTHVESYGDLVFLRIIYDCTYTIYFYFLHHCFFKTIFFQIIVNLPFWLSNTIFVHTVNTLNIIKKKERYNGR